MEKKVYKKQKFKKNSFTVRIGDDDTLRFLNELLSLDIFGSANELLNKCLDIGAPELAKIYLGKKNKAVAPTSTENTNRDLPRSLKQLENTTDDMFVILNILEQMVTTLYNVKAAELSGMPASEDDMRSGRLSDLPENLEAVKEEIIKHYSRRSGS